MIIKESKFIISAVNESQWPNDEIFEVLLCGRSNVGKSSFINTMVNRKNLAYTSSTPGMTRVLNFYDLDHKMRFVDAPGYGFQKKDKASYLSFDEIMSEYFNKRKNLKYCLLLLDIRRDPNEDDKNMLSFIQDNHYPCTIILTKCDKLSGSKINEQKKKILNSLNLPISACVCFSSLNKSGVDEVWNVLDEKLQLNQMQ